MQKTYSTRVGTTQILTLVVLLLGSVGCQTVEDWTDGSVQGPFHQSNNFNLPAGEWPADIQLVAVMPLVGSHGNDLAQRGAELLQPVFTEELSKFTLFETITITPDKLQALLGVNEVRPLDPLPHQFQKIIASLDKSNPDRKVCHAVLFCELTRYNPYPPLSMGWKFRIFDLKTGQTIWAFDEVFDTGNPNVANSARRYMRENKLTSMSIFRDTRVMDSPRALAGYSLAAALATMRENKIKASKETADTKSSQ